MKKLIFQTKISRILLNALPIIVMIGLIPFVQNDYWLTAIYILVMVIAFTIKREPKEWLFWLFGFLIMLIFETFFISTGVEEFKRKSLFGLMPLWLPFLWAYAFVAIKRGIMILKD